MTRSWLLAVLEILAILAALSESFTHRCITSCGPTPAAVTNDRPRSFLVACDEVPAAGLREFGEGHVVVEGGVHLEEALGRVFAGRIHDVLVFVGADVD